MAERRREIGRKKAFLAAYRATANKSKAAEAAKISRASHYKWLNDDPQYVIDFEQACKDAADLLEDEAIRRAHEGVIEPVFYQGKPAGAIRKYSDTLLMFLLRGFRPEVYRERGSLELTGANGSALPPPVLNVTFVRPTRQEPESEQMIGAVETEPEGSAS